MRQIVVHVIGSLLLVVSGASNVSAEPASKEKCTCDLDQREQQDNGAWVKNAAACWSNEYHERQWCDITVKNLENDQRKEAFVGNIVMLAFDDEGDDVAEILKGMFEEYFLTQTETITPADDFDFKSAYAELPSLFDEYSSEIKQCIGNFANWHERRGQYDRIEDGRFYCRVGESSGWLRIGFKFGDVLVFFMVAPNA